jgi:hypothetical protein
MKDIGALVLTHLVRRQHSVARLDEDLDHSGHSLDQGYSTHWHSLVPPALRNVDRQPLQVFCRPGPLAETDSRCKVHGYCA